MSRKTTPRTCSVEGCDRKHRAHGLCDLHRQRFKKYGRTDLPTMADRFWRRVDKSHRQAEFHMATSCWLYHGRLDGGYGSATGGAHRAAWRLTYGEIPRGLHVLHRCDVKPCCRPTHLFLGTNKDNMADLARKGHPNRGEGNGSSRLSDAQRQEICARWIAGGITKAELSRQYGVARTTIIRTIRRGPWLP